MPLTNQKPHHRRLQLIVVNIARQQPPEVITAINGGTVQITPGASLVIVPESTAECKRTVESKVVVVAVIRAEHTIVVCTESISACTTRVPIHLQQVVVCLGPYFEAVVVGVVPVTGATLLQVDLQPTAAVRCQLTEPIVADPVVVPMIAKSDFILRPRTIEEVGPVVLLDQHRMAHGYKTYINISRRFYNLTRTHC